MDSTQTDKAKDTLLQLLAAVRADDAAAVSALLAQRTELKTLIARYVTSLDHPIWIATSTQVARLLLPLSSKQDLKRAIYYAIISIPSRPRTLKALLDAGQEKLGTALRDGNVLVDESTPPSSALHVAALRGAIESIKHLLELNPFLELKDSGGNTPLRFAVKYGQVGAVELLLNAGADPTAAVDDLAVGSDLAVGNDERRRIARLLLDAGARTTNAVGRFLTLLPPHDWDRVIAQAAPARHWRRSEVQTAFRVVNRVGAQRLVAAGAVRADAQVGALHSREAGVLDLVMSHQSEYSLAALAELPTNPDRLHQALSDGLDANSIVKGGYSLLTAAAAHLGEAADRPPESGLRRSIELLVAAGADRSGRRGLSSPLRAFLSGAGCSLLRVAPSKYRGLGGFQFLLNLGIRDALALHYIFDNSWHDNAATFVASLLDAGHDPNAIDRRGRASLHVVAAGETWQYTEELISLLAHAGANPLLVDKQGRTPLDIARKHSRAHAHSLMAAARRWRAQVMRNQMTTVPAPQPHRPRRCMSL